MIRGPNDCESGEVSRIHQFRRSNSKLRPVGTQVGTSRDDVLPTSLEMRDAGLTFVKIRASSVNCW